MGYLVFVFDLPMKTRIFKKCFKQYPKKNYGMSGSRLRVGEYGLKALCGGLIGHSQLEAARIVISRGTNRTGRVRLPVLASRKPIPVTKKPLLTRMGRGVGRVKSRLRRVGAGEIIFEFWGFDPKINQRQVIEVLKRAAQKISIPCVIIKRVAQKGLPR